MEAIAVPTKRKTKKSKKKQIKSIEEPCSDILELEDPEFSSDLPDLLVHSKEMKTDNCIPLTDELETDKHPDIELIKVNSITENEEMNVSKDSDTQLKDESIKSETSRVAENEDNKKEQSKDIICKNKMMKLVTPSAPAEELHTTLPTYNYSGRNLFSELQKSIEPLRSQAAVNLYPQLSTVMSENSKSCVYSESEQYGIFQNLRERVKSDGANREMLQRSSVERKLYPSLSVGANEVFMNTNLEMQHSQSEQVMDFRALNESVKREYAITSSGIRPYTVSQLMDVYRNSELKDNERFIEMFVKYEDKVENHELFQLILRYHEARKQLKASRECLDKLQNKCMTDVHKIWNHVPDYITKEGRCVDRRTVKRTLTYIRAEVNYKVHNAFSHTLENMQNEIKSVYCLHLHTVHYCRLQIELYLYLLFSKKTFQEISATSAVTGYDKRECSAIDVHNIKLLKQCISIVFSFQRRLTHDNEFLEEIRKWLTQLVAVLLRIATLQDHLFILNHVLRCPAGAGEWAACYIQCPTLPSWSYSLQNSNISSSLLDHTITVLATLLYPVRSRETFLQHYKSSVILATGCESSEDNVWVVVDSDNEEELEPFDIWLRWKESDIVAFFNQIPFVDMIKLLLMIDKKDEEEVYDSTKFTEPAMLKLFAVATHLLQIFHKGFNTYQAKKYSQLTKYLSRYISDTIKYVSDHWESFRNNKMCDEPMMKRFQTEFDQFIFRSVICIASAQRKEAWQFLILPYKCISSEMMWKLVWQLYNFQSVSINQEVIYSENEIIAKLQDEKNTEAFQEELGSLEFTEACFLLNALTNMVVSRDPSERLFIQMITTVIFEVSFTVPYLRENMSKEGRDMLFSIVEKHPFVVSSILKQLKVNLRNVGKAAVYLFKKIPLHDWKPTPEDIELISEWLLSESLSSHSNHLSRLIISNMNWGLNRKRDSFALDVNVHQKIAVSIVQAYSKFIKVQDNKNIINWGFQQLCEFVSVVRSAMTTATASDEQGFIAWTWEILYTLRLHALDAVNPPFAEVMDGCVVREEIPNCHSVSWVHPIKQGIEAEPVNPVACYMAIVLTTVGHSANNICKEGVDLLWKLIEAKQFVAVVNALSYMMPFFYKNVDGLLQNEKFVKCFQVLLMADLTYLELAKSMAINVDFPGKVLLLVASVIKFQIEACRSIGSSSNVVRLWLQILVKLLISAIKKGMLEKWKNINHVYYLLDEICRISFNDHFTRDAVFKEIRALQKEFLSIPIQPQHWTSTLTSLIMRTSSTEKPSLIATSQASKFAWFAWYAMTVECESSETETIWKQVMMELVCNPTITVANALKKVATGLNVNFPASSLPIYKWGQLAISILHSDPLHPLYWQQFFNFYLQRVPASPSVSERGSLGQRFYENSSEFGTLKQMKAHLKDSLDYHHNLIAKIDSELASANSVKSKDDLFQKKEFHENIMNLYRAYAVWLEEPCLREASLKISDLPETYDKIHLSYVLKGNRQPWFSFVNVQQIQMELNKSLNSWYLYKKAIKEISSDDNQKTEDSPSKRILTRLNRYEKALPPPGFKQMKRPITEIPNESIRNYDTLKSSIYTDLQVLRENAKDFSEKLMLLKDLDSKFLKDVLQLYKNVETQKTVKKSCTKGEEGTEYGCTGAAILNFEIEERQRDEKMNIIVESNRKEYHLVYTELLKPFSEMFCNSSCRITNCLKKLAQETEECKQSGNQAKCKEFCRIAMSLFYYLMEYVDDTIKDFLPTKDLIVEQLRFLGNQFERTSIEEMHLLEKISDYPHIMELVSVAELFNPDINDTETYLQMYDFLLEKIHKLPMNILCVLLNKFDVSKWLRTSKRTMAQRNKLIDSLGRALCSFGLELEDNEKEIYAIYESQLETMLIYNFPDHYSEVLHMLLNGMDTFCLNKNAWFTFMHTLEYPLKSNMQLEDKNIIREYARKQRMLTPYQVHETIELIGKHFEQKLNRLVDGSNLYDHYKYYISAIRNFLIMMGYASIATLYCRDESVCIEKLWTELEEAFSPWIKPSKSGKMPWRSEQDEDASQMFEAYSMCLSYLDECVYECIYGNTILPMVWKYYVKTYETTTQVMDNVKAVCQKSLLCLPWIRFYPQLEDIYDMNKIVEVPESVTFVSSVFVKIDWTSVIHHLTTDTSNAHTDTEVLPELINLIVKLAWEPSIVETGNLPKILKSAEACTWHQVDFITLAQVVNTFVEKCDPLCILEDKRTRSMDALLLRFLRVITCMEPNPFICEYPETLQHRLLFVHTCTQLLIKCADKYPTMLEGQHVMFKNSIDNLLQHIESAIKHNVGKTNEFKQSSEMMKKLLSILNDAPMTELRNIVKKTLVNWLSHHPSSILVLPCLHAAGKSLSCMQYLVEISECCIVQYFSSNPNSVQTALSFLPKYIDVPDSLEDEFLELCSKDNLHLTQYVYIEKLLLEGKTISEEAQILQKLIKWNDQLKPTTKSEPKLILLWDKILELSLKQIDTKNESIGRMHLKAFCEQLINFGKEQIKLLFWKKSISTTPQFKFLSRIMAAFILVQMPSNGGIRLTEYAPGHIICNSPPSSPNEKEVSLSNCKPDERAKECVKQLEALLNDRNYSSVKRKVEEALNFISDAANHLRDSRKLLRTFTNYLYDINQYKFLKLLDQSNTQT